MSVESRREGRTLMAKNTILHQAQKGIVNVPERLKVLDARQNFAVLATSGEGQPYTSLVSFALTPDGEKFIFATSKKTSKYKNILRSSRVAVLIDNRPSRAEKIMTAEAITVLGEARLVRRGALRNEMAQILLAKHPGLAGFLSTSTTALICVRIHRCIHVGQFQRITIWQCRK